jgi:DNA-directed RNA polymerase subunit RPC12/RpoP
MFARVTCPACQYKLSIPEGDMGRRHVCPNCQSPFFAGKSVADGDPAAPPSAAAQAAAASQGGYAKTLLGEMAPPIKFNCPRCKAPLEAPASEAGTKKPCPSCGQRLQVPAPPPPPEPAPVQAGLNKTMMASDESKAAPPIKYNCPNCKKPLESPASEAGMKKNCPACSQRLQIPAAPSFARGLNKTIMATDESRALPAGAAAGYLPTVAGAVAAGPAPAPQAPAASSPFSTRNLLIAACVLLLLLIAVPAVIRGGKVDNSDALAKANQEIERLKLEIDKRKDDLEKQKHAEAETRRQLEDMARKIQAQDEKMRADHLQALRDLTDQKQKNDLEKKFEEAQRKWELDKREMEKNQQKLLADVSARLKESNDALKDAERRQQTIIHQPPPPPVIYYPPYHPRYYWPWW